MRAVAALLLGALVVVAATRVGASWVLPEAPSPEAAPVTTSRPGVTTTTVTASDGPPAAIGGALEVTGDRSGSVELAPASGSVVRLDAVGSFLAPASLVSGRQRLEGDGATVTVRWEPQHGPYLDQLAFQGLNVFLDPDDCELTTEEENPARGVARLAVSCGGVTDVHGEATIDIAGTLDLPIRLAHPGDAHRSTGELAVHGALQAEAAFADILWMVFPEDYLAGGEEPPRGFSALSSEGDGTWGLTFDVDEAGDPSLAHVWGEGAAGPGEGYVSFQPEGGDCTVASVPAGVIAPDTELVDVQVECPEITALDSDLTVSIVADLRVYRHEPFPAEPRHEP